MVKKTICLLIMVCLYVGLVAYSNDVWTEDFSLAMKRSQDENKPIFMLFTGSDWCPPCMALDREVFSQPEFLDFANEFFVLLKIDRPRNIEQSAALVLQNQQLFQKYEILGVPTIKIIDFNENILATTGYQGGGALVFIEHIKELLQ
jgi:protein disulfide-isomerase